MPIGAFFMNIQIVLALCLRFVSAIHLQLDREVGNNRHKLPAWQKMSPNISKDVSDMKFKIASWIEKQNLAQPNFSDSDQSESSSSSNFDQLQQKGKEINRQEPRQERSRSGNFFGSIYFERDHSRRDKKNRSEAENDHEVGRRLSDVSDHYSQVRGSDASSDQHLYGRHSNASDQYSFNGHDQIHHNNEIVEVERADLDGTLNHKNNSKSPETLSEMPDRTNQNATALSRMGSDLASNKCGKMPNLGKMPKLGKMPTMLSLKLDIIYWKKCITNFLSREKTKKYYLTNGDRANDRRHNGKAHDSDRQLFLLDHPEWNDGTTKLGWGPNPFQGPTPSF